MERRIEFVSILLAVVVSFSCFFSNSVFVNQMVGISDNKEKLVFCTFDEGTTNVNYTPTTLN